MDTLQVNPQQGVLKDSFVHESYLSIMTTDLLTF